MKKYLQTFNLIRGYQIGVMYFFYSVYDMVIEQQKKLQGK
jgi:hypothetical protein